DLPARSEMQLGECLAGMAIENSMLGAAHALANPLTAAHGIAHGHAIAFMLPHVIRHNGRRVDSWYRELAESDGEISFGASQNAADALADFIAEISQRAGLAGKLNDCGVP